MMMHMQRLLAMVLTIGAIGLAQTRPATRKAAPSKPAPSAAAPAASRWPIARIVVEGNRIFTREQVLAVARLRVGEVAGKPEFEAARDRLVASGAFETVSYKFAAAGSEGYVATLQVAEVEQVYPVVFQELGVSSLELMETLKAKDPLIAAGKLPATQPALERHRKWVEEFVAAKGSPEKIAAGVMPSTPGELTIVFRPARNLPAVAQVTFSGNQLLGTEALADAIVGPAVGSAYTEDSFRQILNSSIRPLYDARGRLRVAFPQVRAEKLKGVEGLHVFVTVEEGPAFELGKVTLEGPSPIRADALLKAGEFRTGEPANMDAVNQGLERMRMALRRAGYMEARVVSERRIDDVNKKVDVVARANAGPAYTMGTLTITGLDLNAEAEMRRIWTMREGRPFNPEYPDLFLRRVQEQAMFDNLKQTKADLKVNESSHTVDVTLSFR